MAHVAFGAHRTNQPSRTGLLRTLPIHSRFINLYSNEASRGTGRRRKPAKAKSASAQNYGGARSTSRIAPASRFPGHREQVAAAVAGETASPPLATSSTITANVLHARSNQSMVNEKDEPKRIAIACQGGGSHTAFTAGALRRILKEIQDKRSYEIVALSGTSGGAICAFLAWYALLENNNELAAMEALCSFWKEDNAAYLRVGDLDSVWDVLANDVLSASTLLRRVGETALGVGFNPELNPYRYHQLIDFWRRRLKQGIEKNIKEIDPDLTDKDQSTAIDQSIARRVESSARD